MAKAEDRELFDEELVLLIMAVATLIMAVGVGYVVVFRWDLLEIEDLDEAPAKDLTLGIVRQKRQKKQKKKDVQGQRTFQRLKKDESWYGRWDDDDEIKEIASVASDTPFEVDNNPSSDTWLAKTKRVATARIASVFTGPTVTETLNVGKGIPVVIGKGGKTIQRIQDVSGARVDVERTTNVVTLKGPATAVASAKHIIEALVDGRESDLPEEMQQPKAEAEETIECANGRAGAIIGPKGATIREIQEKSGARIDIEKGEDNDVIKVSGSSAAVSKAVKIINQIVNPVYECEETVEVGRAAPSIVGTKGATIEALRKLTGAAIEIERGSSVVTIKGTKVAVKSAQLEILKLVNPPMETMEVKESYGVGAILGTAGENINKMQDESGARINIAKRRGRSEQVDIIEIKGQPDQIRKARALIARAVAAAKPEMVETLEVETASAVIGRGGETIRKLQEESGARLDIEKTTEIDPETEKPKKGDVITVSGSKTAVPKALKMIDALLNPVYEAEEEIDAGDKAPRVVGPKGATITGVREDTGAYVELARGSSIVSIKGTTEAVAKAKAMIELILDPPFEAMEIDVRDGAGAIIGPNGDTIRKIQDESGARVDIKRNKNGNDTMNISGLPEAIEKAKVMLQQVLDDARPEAEQTVLCDSAAAVIGAKGVTIRAIQDESGASINIGRDEEKKKDTIHVSGLTVNVADAIDMIDAILNPRYEHQEDMLFDLKDAGLIVGPKGATIRALQEQTGAVIEVGKGAEKDILTAKGKTDGVKAAIAAVKLLIEENNYHEDMILKPSDIGAVIGKGGEVIRKIQQQSGARLEKKGTESLSVGLNPTSGAPSGMPAFMDVSTTVLRINGSKSQVSAARALVTSVMRNGSDAIMGTNYRGGASGGDGERVFVPAYAVATVIGKKGASIQFLEKESGAKVQLMTSGISGDDRVATVKGDGAAIAKAVEMLTATIMKLKEGEEEKGRKMATLSARATAANEKKGAKAAKGERVTMAIGNPNAAEKSDFLSGIDDEAAEEADEPSVQQLMREKGTSFPMKGTPKKKGKASDTASSELSPQAELLAALDMAGEAGVLAERPKKEKRVVHRPSGGE